MKTFEHTTAIKEMIWWRLRYLEVMRTAVSFIRNNDVSDDVRNKIMGYVNYFGTESEQLKEAIESV